MEIDAAKFDKVARTLFAPIYPLIAEQILAKTGIIDGCCLDMGCGGGYLGIELARRSELSLVFLDQSVDMLDIVRRNLVANQMDERARTVLADAENIPLPDDSVNLAVSRGSAFGKTYPGPSARSTAFWPPAACPTLAAGSVRRL